jgi:AcrR family transcriptional regulator
MPSNKSRPQARSAALEPRRNNGRLRVAALLEAGAAVVAERGFTAATMTEIASRAGAPIGSLYRFFPNKEILADALLQRYVELLEDAFGRIHGRIKSMSTAELAGELLDIIPDFYREKLTIRALLETDPEGSAKRDGFRSGMRRQIAKTLLLRSPKLDPGTAKDMAVVLIQNIKMAGFLKQEFQGDALAGALAELREMTRLYLMSKLAG